MVKFFLFCLLFFCLAAKAAPQFRVVAFYTGKNDLAHISFVHEANHWFPKWLRNIISFMIPQPIGMI